MKAAASWEEANSQYLSAALEWLRLRLELFAEGGFTAKTAARKKRGGASSKKTETSAQENQAERAKEEVPREGLAERLSAADAEMQSLESQMKTPPALTVLSRTLGLSKFEQNVLLLCAAPEFDPAIPALCARAQSDVRRESPTFSLALQLFEDPGWEALSPERPLRYWRLIEINQPGAQALTTSALRADERIVNYIKGLNYVDDRLAPYLAAMGEWKSVELPASQQEVVEQVKACWNSGKEDGPVPLVQLAGRDHASKLMIAARAAAGVERRLYRISAETLPTQTAELELLARLWQRESALLPLSLYLDANEIDASPSDAHAASVRRFLGRVEGLLMLGVREPWASLPRETFVFDAAKPTVNEQRAAWRSVLGAKNEAAAALLAAQFNLNVPDIERIAEEADLGKRAHDEAGREKLWDACRARLRPTLDMLAHRIEPKAHWDDIVLPAEQMSLLRQIATQVKQRGTVYEDWGFSHKMNRGLGITSLFAGDSGTGKTTAAEVIANDLRLNLYRIDLSAVVSKYIGETEKNLRRLFDAAEDGGAILLFDEADALFGKRSEVKDSHDRYANIEINYLLQRMEAYSGLAILATNMRSALDVAFTRRLRFIVSFPFPNAADRKRMWQKAFPPETPVDTLDYDKLARLNLTGGGISNAAVNAAFLAAQSNESVGMGMALAAARQELIKLDRPINEADFRWQPAAGVVA